MTDGNTQLMAELRIASAWRKWPGQTGYFPPAPMLRIIRHTPLAARQAIPGLTGGR